MIELNSVHRIATGSVKPLLITCFILNIAPLLASVWSVETQVNGSLIRKFQASSDTAMLMKIKMEIRTHRYNYVDIGAGVFKYA
ncbi:MAG: hypothetical protein AAB308_13985 [Nitrospirota bacterium]